MKKIDRNYSQLERRILETANGQIFIDKTVLLGKVLKMPENTGITEADVENCLQKLTEQNSLSLHTCYTLEDKSITNEFIFRVAKIMTPIVILAAILIQIYLMLFI